MLIENSAICAICFDTISSNWPSLSQTCSCQNITISGGLKKPKVVGGDYVDLSWSLDEGVLEECIQAIGAEKTLTVLRILRSRERVVADGELRILAAKDDEIMVCHNFHKYSRYRKVNEDTPCPSI